MCIWSENVRFCAGSALRAILCVAREGVAGLNSVGIFKEHSMSETDKSIPPLASGEVVAGKLIDELHDANKKLTHAREHVEAAQIAEHDGLTERERASDEVHDAEEKIEKADEKIREALKENEKR
jgi:hypothetical protein